MSAQGEAGLGFRADIEGLRAVAVLAVVWCHASARGGGYVGVDVFFVISGFLITRLLLAELAATGGINLTRFYAARARRLLPASATVLIATAAAAVWLLPPLSTRPVLGDGLASALYVVNYRFAANGTDYLAAVADSPFQHYWSLAVEEQFYFAWPVLLVGLAWLWRLRHPTASTRPYRIGLGGIGAVSLLLCVLWTHSSPSGGLFLLPPWAFFSLPTRAWELAFGGMIALAAAEFARLSPGLARALGVGGLAIIGAAIFGFDRDIPYPGAAALAPVLGATLVIAAGCAVPGSGAGRLLSAAPMRWIGRVSYSWYLWHWPLLVFVPLVIDRHARVIAVVASLALASLTWRYVERPARYSESLRLSVRRSLSLAAAATVVSVFVAAVLPALIPNPIGAGPAGAQIASGSEADVQRLVSTSATQPAVPRNLAPPLPEVMVENRTALSDRCIQSWRGVDVPDCVTGRPGSRTTVALIGDSHAAMWQPGLQYAALQSDWRLVTMAKNTCPLPDRTIYNPFLGRQYPECDQWRRAVFARLRVERPKLVVVSVSRRYGPRWDFASTSDKWASSLATLISEIRETTDGAVLVLGPVPDPQTDVPVCLSDHLDDVAACTPTRQAAVKSAIIAAEGQAAVGAGGLYADLSTVFCTGQSCPVVIGRYLVFRDDNHLTTTYASALGPVLRSIADRAMTQAT